MVALNLPDESGAELLSGYPVTLGKAIQDKHGKQFSPELVVPAMLAVKSPRQKKHKQSSPCRQRKLNSRLYSVARDNAASLFGTFKAAVATKFFDSTGPFNGEDKTQSDSGHRFR